MVVCLNRRAPSFSYSNNSKSCLHQQQWPDLESDLHRPQMTNECCNQSHCVGSSVSRWAAELRSFALATFLESARFSETKSSIFGPLRTRLKSPWILDYIEQLQTDARFLVYSWIIKLQEAALESTLSIFVKFYSTIASWPCCRGVKENVEAYW
jgi:hypothetical protein